MAKLAGEGGRNKPGWGQLGGGGKRGEEKPQAGQGRTGQDRAGPGGWAGQGRARAGRGGVQVRSLILVAEGHFLRPLCRSRNLAREGGRPGRPQGSANVMVRSNVMIPLRRHTCTLQRCPPLPPLFPKSCTLTKEPAANSHTVRPSGSTCMLDFSGLFFSLSRTWVAQQQLGSNCLLLPTLG